MARRPLPESGTGELILRIADLRQENMALEAESEVLLQDAVRKQARLVKPGVKLGINASLGVAGLALAPITFGASLILSVVSIGMTAWDVVDFGRDVADLVRRRKQVRQLQMLAVEIDVELCEIIEILGQRNGPSGNALTP